MYLSISTEYIDCILKANSKLQVDCKGLEDCKKIIASTKMRGELEAMARGM